jgi:uncharacterized protein (TIGR02246 family)
MRATGTAAAAVMVLVGCQQAETPAQLEARMATESAAARTAIEAVNADFVTHFNQGHGEQVAAFYTEDGVVMPPNAPAVEGREAIKGMVASMAGAQLTLMTQSVVANGPLAVERGRFRITFTPAGAPAAITDSGKYLVHWHNVGGKWLLAADMFNSDIPMAPPPAPPPAK